MVPMGEDSQLVLDCGNLSFSIRSTRYGCGPILQEGKGVSSRRYRDHTRLAGQGGDGEMKMMGNRYVYLESGFCLRDFRLVGH